MRGLKLLLALLCMAITWPAQTAEARVPVVGVLVLGIPDPAPFIRGFRKGLEDLGYVEGEHFSLTIRSAEGEVGRLPALADSLVEDRVDIIVAYQTPAAMAAKAATRSIPIVLAYVGDPVRNGIVRSLSRPGGNITGSSVFGPELAVKNVELTRQLLPGARHLAVLANAADPFAGPLLEIIGTTARRWAFDMHLYMTQPAASYDAVVALMKKDGMDVVLVQPSLFNQAVVDEALGHRLPSVSFVSEFARDGGLMAYSARSDDAFREPAAYVDMILGGASPGDLPIQQPTRYELILNLVTARRLGLTVPDAVTVRVDEFIE